MESRIRLSFLALIIAVGLFAPAVLGAQPPSVTSVTEGKDPATGNPVLLINGKGLNSIVDIDLVDPAGPTLLESPTVIVKKSGYLHLALPGGMAPGTYDLSLTDKAGRSIDLSVSVGNGKALPGSVETEALSASLRADLDDASTLNGNPGSHYLTAGNLTGTVGTALFSAYGDLAAEGKIGTGGSQVAQGDHDHDERYAVLSHTHEPTDHDHDATYAKRGLVGAKVYRTSSLALPANDSLTIPFQAEEFDTDGCFTTGAPTRLTAGSAGYYLVIARLGFEAGLTGCTIQILKNGVVACEGVEYSNSGARDSTVEPTVLHLEEGDYIEVVFQNNFEPGFDLRAGQGVTEFSMVRIGE